MATSVWQRSHSSNRLYEEVRVRTMNHQTLVYIIKDFFINFIRRQTEWLHKITRYLGHTSLFIFKLHMTRIFWGFNFYLTCKFGQTCKYCKICILHNKISFWRDQISNFIPADILIQINVKRRSVIFPML